MLGLTVPHLEVEEFSPADVSGLLGWWKADTLVLNDGDAVSSLVNQANPGTFDADTTVNAQPVYKAATFNSAYPAIRSEDIAKRGLRTSAVVTNATDNFTIFVAVQSLVTTRSTGGEGRVCVSNGSMGSNGVGVATVTTDAAVRYGFLRGGIAWHTSSLSTTTGARLIIVRRSSGTMNLYIGGGAAVATTASAPNTPTTATYLLNNNTGNHDPGADLAEAGIYNVALSDAEVNQVGDYMAARYGLSWAPVS